LVRSSEGRKKRGKDSIRNTIASNDELHLISSPGWGKGNKVLKKRRYKGKTNDG